MKLNQLIISPSSCIKDSVRNLNTVKSFRFCGKYWFYSSVYTPSCTWACFLFFIWQCKSLYLKRVRARADILISLSDDPSRIQAAETKPMSNQNPLASFRGPHISPLPGLNNEGFQRLSSRKVQLRGLSEIRFDSAALLIFNLERW